MSFTSSINTNTNTDDQNPVVVAQPAPVKKPLSNPDNSNGILYAKDGRGRRIGCKKLTAIDLFDLTGVMGEHSGNRAMLNQAMIAASVVEIDGDHTPRPQSWVALRARIALLDFDGYLAVSEALTGAPAVNTNADAIKKLAAAADFREPLLLMKRFGYSEETAFGMSPGVRMAAFVVHGEDEGNELSL